jgi:hypothetical protein
MKGDVFTILKEGGKVKAAALRAHLDSLPDGSYFVNVEQATKRKSQAQNSYLHVLFTIAAKELNREGFGDGSQWTKERVKAHCKREGLYPMEDVVMPGGVVGQVWKETRDLSKEEAMETIDRVIRYFAEWSIVLPEPNTQLQLAA